MSTLAKEAVLVVAPFFPADTLCTQTTINSLKLPLHLYAFITNAIKEFLSGN